MNSPQKIRLFIGDLPPAINKSDILAKLFQYGRVGEKIDFKSSKKTGKMMLFFDVSSKETAINLLIHPIVFKGVEYYCQKSQHNQNHMFLGCENHGIHVSNMPKMMSDQEIGDFFSKFGSVISCFSIKFHNGNSRGYGFVYFELPEVATKLIKKRKIKIKGKFMVIKSLELKNKIIENQRNLNYHSNNYHHVENQGTTITGNKRRKLFYQTDVIKEEMKYKTPMKAILSSQKLERIEINHYFENLRLNLPMKNKSRKF